MDENMQVVVLFDGVCVLCSGWVRFCLPRDRKARLRFAALQEPVGQKLLAEHHFSQTEFRSVVVLADGKVYERASAVVRILGELGVGWRLLGGLLGLFPKRLLNLGYDWVAGNRYRWFGKNETCFLPSPEERARFL